MVGIRQHQLFQQLSLTGIKHTSNVTYHNILHKLQKRMEVFGTSKIKQNRDKLKEKNSNIDVVFDCRWSKPRGYNSEQGTVICLEMNSGNLLGIANMVRVRTKKLSSQNYIGSAKAMEGTGVTQICELFQKENLQIANYAHDDDAQTRSVISKFFPQAKEDICIGHVAKNLRNTIKNLAKQSKYKALKGFGQSAYRWLFISVKMVKKDIQNGKITSNEAIIELQKNIKLFINHACGDHSFCKHEAKKYPKIPSSEIFSIEELNKIINQTAEKAASYIRGKTVNMVESCNSAIASICSKYFDWPTNYSFLVMCGALTFSEHSSVWKEEFLCQSGYKFSEYTKMELTKEKKRKKKDSERKQTEQYKTKKVQLKELKRQRNKVTNKEKKKDFTYKKNEDVIQKCHCKTDKNGVNCTSNRCSCRNLKCNFFCKCKGENCLNNPQGTILLKKINFKDEIEKEKNKSIFIKKRKIGKHN